MEQNNNFIDFLSNYSASRANFNDKNYWNHGYYYESDKKSFSMTHNIETNPKKIKRSSKLETPKHNIKIIKYKLNENLNEDGYKYFSNESTDIKYRFNSDGFRSLSFETIMLNDNKINFLIGGCSGTFGYELPQEMTWPIILKKSLDNKNIKNNFFNVSAPGLNSIEIIRNIYLFIEKYKSPDYILLLLPALQRRVAYDKKYKIFGTIQDPIELYNVENFERLIINGDENLLLTFLNLVSEIKNLESLCKILNIKLYWYSWCPVANEIYNKMGFNNFIFDIQNTEIFEIDESSKYLNFAADNDHPGLLYNSGKAKIFDKSINLNCLT